MKQLVVVLAEVERVAMDVQHNLPDSSKFDIEFNTISPLELSEYTKDLPSHLRSLYSTRQYLETLRSDGTPLDAADAKCAFQAFLEIGCGDEEAEGSVSIVETCLRLLSTFLSRHFISPSQTNVADFVNELADNLLHCRVLELVRRQRTDLKRGLRRSRKSSTAISILDLASTLTVLETLHALFMSAVGHLVSAASVGSYLHTCLELLEYGTAFFAEVQPLFGKPLRTLASTTVTTVASRYTCIDSPWSKRCDVVCAIIERLGKHARLTSDNTSFVWDLILLMLETIESALTRSPPVLKSIENHLCYLLIHNSPSSPLELHRYCRVLTCLWRSCREVAGGALQHIFLALCSQWSWNDSSHLIVLKCMRDLILYGGQDNFVMELYRLFDCRFHSVNVGKHVLGFLLNHLTEDPTLSKYLVPGRRRSSSHVSPSRSNSRRTIDHSESEPTLDSTGLGPEILSSNGSDASHSQPCSESSSPMPLQRTLSDSLVTVSQRSHTVQEKALCMQIYLECLLQLLPSRDRPTSASVVTSSVSGCQEMEISLKYKELCIEATNVLKRDGMKAFLNFVKRDACLSTEEVASLIRFTPRVDLKQVGEILGEKDDFCLDVLNRFMGLFNFSNQSVEIALRSLLQTFWLPGEAQKIYRIFESFSKRYVDCNPNGFNENDVFLLSYSIIMLHTNHHNPNVSIKDKLSLPTFKAQLQSTAVPDHMKEQIYDSITHEPMAVWDGGYVRVPFVRWTVMVDKPVTVSESMGICQGVGVRSIIRDVCFRGYDAVMKWLNQSLVASESTIEQCLYGLLVIADVAVQHDLAEVVDRICLGMCDCIEALLQSALCISPTPSFPLQSFLDGQPSEVHRGMAFVRSAKSQVLLVWVVVYAIRYANHLRTAWTPLLRVLSHLQYFQVIYKQFRLESPHGFAESDLIGLEHSNVWRSVNEFRPESVHTMPSVLTSHYGLLDALPEQLAHSNHDDLTQTCIETIMSAFVSEFMSVTKWLTDAALVDLMQQMAAVVAAEGSANTSSGPDSVPNSSSSGIMRSKDTVDSVPVISVSPASPSTGEKLPCSTLIFYMHRMVEVCFWNRYRLEMIWSSIHRACEIMLLHSNPTVVRSTAEALCCLALCANDWSEDTDWKTVKRGLKLLKTVSPHRTAIVEVLERAHLIRQEDRVMAELLHWNKEEVTRGSQQSHPRIDRLDNGLAVESNATEEKMPSIQLTHAAQVEEHEQQQRFSDNGLRDAVRQGRVKRFDILGF